MKHKSFPYSGPSGSGAEPSVEPGPEATSNHRRHHAPLKLERILVPVDFSECSLRALDYALAFAEEFHARVILLHVVEPTIVTDNYLAGGPVMEETNQNLLEAGRERLEELARQSFPPNFRGETLVRMGRAHSEIPDTAKALGVDMIILGTHGYTGLKHVLLGSTAERVVRQAPCAVLTVRQSSRAASAA